MNKIALIYWPERGNVQAVANKFYNRLDPNDVIMVSLGKLDKKLLEQYDHWIIGGSTVGSHIWEDADDTNKWNEFFKLLGEMDLTNKKVAFFGLGDQVLYPNHFVDGLGVLQEEFISRKAKIVGQWPTKGYDFTESNGVNNGMFFGLAIDQDNQEELTDARINEWLKLIGPEFGI